MFQDLLLSHQQGTNRKSRQHRRSSYSGSSICHGPVAVSKVSSDLSSPRGRRRSSMSAATSLSPHRDGSGGWRYPQDPADSEDDRTGLLSSKRCTRRYSLDCMDGVDRESIWSAPLRLGGGSSIKEPKNKLCEIAPNSSPGSPSFGTPTGTPENTTKPKVLNVLTLMRKESPVPFSRQTTPTSTYTSMPGRSTDDDFHSNEPRQEESAGVKLWEGSAPLQSADGHVSAEIEDPERRKSPILVQFYSPWPVRCTSKGLEVGKEDKPERAFVQMISTPMGAKKLQGTKLTNVVLDNVLRSNGKFEINGDVSNIKCKCITPDDLLLTTFACAAPGTKPVERRMFLKLRWVHESTLVVLAVHTTVHRFHSKERSMIGIADSLKIYGGNTHGN